ncbi:vasoactive intestinal polypeptide receptor 2-like [Sinocyclocheilus anshuiensis]|uniref:vasoactive intestinal polypeptide receptor 2-like n=1 Tax=Sinocyclocheilus anshuiensis TaxID=1608454 RepID=UPI0007B9ED9D|nr:PREDICTED: vasoactive intestinal polypeptide receptor 2-like [Sinocyclocheilus anshuiensis]
MKMNLVNNCLAFLLVWQAHAVSGRHANCHFLYEVQMAEKECLGMLADELPPHTKGCRGMWDNISCWHHADIGEVVVNTCPAALKNLFTRDAEMPKPGPVMTFDLACHAIQQEEGKMKKKKVLI